MSAGWRRALVLAVALMVALLPWATQRLTAPQAEWLLGSSRVGLTVDDERATALAMPHRWRTDCADCRVLWYHFDLDRPELPNEAQAVYLPSVGQNAAVYLNGRLLGSGGRFSDPMARLGERALLFSAPAALWSPGANRLYVLVKADRPRFGHLPAPAIAAEVLLQPLERWRSLLAVTLPQVLAAAAAMLGVVMGVLWFYRRRRTEYAALAGAMLAWSLNAFSALAVEPPWPAPWWDAWLSATLATAALALLLLARRMAGAASMRPASKAAAVVLVGLAAATAWEPQGLALEAARALALALLIAAGAVLARAGWRGDDARLLLPGAALALLAGAELAILVWPLLPYATLAALHWGMAVVLGALAWMLLLRFVQTLNAVELLNIDLESLVQARTAELQAQFERVRELERAQVLATERERLMRDMHDGVGGHLVSLLAMIEADRRRPGELATAVRDALDDMRLMIDSLDPVDDDLNAVLAMWRDRLAPRMRLVDVALHWEVDLLGPVAGLTPARVLHVLRILQEAVTNAIRHGRAGALWLAASEAAEGVRITLRDDGAGFDAQAIAGGRGLKNMHRRAAEVGATLHIESQAGRGTTVTLVLPRA